jgi:hypothetical protein
MPKHDITHLEAKIKDLQGAFKSVGDDSDLIEMLKILHRPGWTTPAEFLYVDSIVESLQAQARNVLTLRKALLAGSREVQGERTASA